VFWRHGVSFPAHAVAFISHVSQGRNGGHVKYTPYEEYARLSKAYSRNDCADIVRFQLRHLDALLQFARSLGNEAELHSEMREVETLDVFYDQSGFEKAVKHLNLYLRDFPDEKATWCVYKGQEAQTKFSLPRACGVFVFKAGAAAPYNLITTALAQLASRHSNFSIHPHSPIVSLEPSTFVGMTVARTASGGMVSARNVVHATNGYVSHLLPGLAGKILPVRGTMTSHPPGEHFPAHDGGARSWSFVWQQGFDYCIQRPDGTVMLGGGLLRAEDDGLADIGTAADDESHISILASAHLRGLPPVVFGDDHWGAVPAGAKTWTGVIGLSADMMPWVGALGPEATGRLANSAREWVCAGYGGEGMVNAWLCGKALACMIRGEPDGLPALFCYSATRLKKAYIEDHVDDYMGSA
jgi:glycine/D-amino acid oxidase-like deaminating enzyme